MALQPSTPDPLFAGSTPEQISRNPSAPLSPAPRTVRRQGKDTVGARLQDMDSLIAAARRHAARGDVESANRVVNEVESFIDDNQIALENLANATNVRSEDARAQQSRATGLLEGAYLRENLKMSSGGQDVELPLSAMLSAENNPNAETFSALKRARNLGNETLEELSSGETDLTATSALYHNAVGMAPTTLGVSMPGADASTYDKQMFFATQAERFKNGEFGDLTDESLAQVMREVLRSGDKDNPQSLDQMCDVFDNILGMAAGDYSSRGISDAASRYQACRNKALLGADGKPVPDDGMTSDLMTAARQLSEASWGSAGNSVQPSADLFSVALEDQELLRDYNILRDHGVFKGMSKAEKETALRSLVASHAAQTLGPGLGVLDDYAENPASKNLKTLIKTFDEVQDDISKFDAPLQDPERPDELLTPTDAQAYLAEPMKILSDTLKSYLAERSRNQVFDSPSQALAALAEDPAAVSTIAEELSLNTTLDKRVCSALAEDFLQELKEVKERGDMASFDPDEFYKKFTATEESELHRELKEEDEKLEGIAARIQQGAVLSEDESRLWSRSRDHEAGLPVDELDKFTDGGDFTKLGVEMDNAYNEVVRGYFGDPSTLDTLGTATLNSSEYQHIISKVQRDIEAANGDPEATKKVLDAFVNGGAGYQLPFPQIANKFGAQEGLTLSTALNQVATSDPELTSLTVQALLQGDADTASAALSELFQVYLSEYAPITHPDAIQKYSSIYKNSFSRDVAQLKHTIAERRANGSLPKDVPLDAEHRLEGALRTVLQFEVTRQSRAGAPDAKAHETLNFSGLDNMVESPGEMAALNTAITHSLYYGDDNQKAAAREAIYNLTAIYYGKEAAQTAVDNTMFAGVGAELFNKITEIRSEANKAHAETAKDSRSRQGNFDTALLVADVLSLGGKAAVTGVARLATKSGTTAANNLAKAANGVVDAAKTGLVNRVTSAANSVDSALRHSALADKVATKVANLRFSKIPLGGKRWQRLTMHGMRRHKSGVEDLAGAIKNKIVNASPLIPSAGGAAASAGATATAGATAAAAVTPPWYKNVFNGVLKTAAATGRITGKTAMAIASPAFNRTTALAMGGMTTTGLSVAARPGVTPYTPINNPGVIQDQYDSFGTNVGASYDSQANALQATQDTADASSHGFGSGAMTVLSSGLTGASVGSWGGPVGTVVGGVVGLATGLGFVLYDVFDASSDTERISQEEKQKVLDLMTSTIDELQNNPQVSDDCKAVLARAISGQQISSNMSVDERGQAYLRAIQTFAGTMKTRFEMDARNAAKNLGGLYTAFDKQLVADRALARGENLGVSYSTAMKGGLRKNSDEASFFRRALRAQKPSLAVNKDRVAINHAASAVMAQVGREISKDDPVFRNMVNTQLVEWTKDYNDLVKSGKTRGLESNLQSYLINRAGQERLGEGLRNLNLRQRREEAMATHIPSEGKSLERVQQEQQIKLNASIAEGKANLENKKAYKMWEEETFPDD